MQIDVLSVLPQRGRLDWASAFVAFASIGLYQFLVASLMVGLLLGEMCSPLLDPDSGVLIFALFLEVELFGATFATDSSVSRRLRLRAAIRSLRRR